MIQNRKNCDDFFLKFCDLSGAKDCKSCRSRKMLQNEYLVAIVAVHTAENEPLKVWGDLLPPQGASACVVDNQPTNKPR